jgi:hypothetical protein
MAASSKKSGSSSASKRAGGSSSSRTGSGARSSGASRGRSGSNSSQGSGAAQVTTDHDEIQRWVEERGGKPACVRGTGGRGDTGLLRIDFPDGPEAKLQPISWEDFFEKFEENNLAFLYQDKDQSRFNKLVGRDTVQARNQGEQKASRGRLKQEGRSAGGRSSRGPSGSSQSRARSSASQGGSSRGGARKTASSRVGRSAAGKSAPAKSGSSSGRSSSGSGRKASSASRAGASGQNRGRR